MARGEGLEAMGLPALHFQGLIEQDFNIYE